VSDAAHKAGSTSASAGTVPALAWILLVALTFAWGAMWPLLKITVAEIPLFSYRAGSAVVAGILLFAVTWLSGFSARPVRGEFRKIAVVGTFGVALWFILSGLSVSLLPAGRAALLAYTMPFWALVVAILFLGEHVTVKRCVGVSAGLGAILLLSWESLVAGSKDVPLLGIAVVLCAAVVWSVGSTLQKEFAFKTPVSAHLAWQLMIGAIPLTCVALLVDSTAWVATVSADAMLAGLIVTVFSLAFGLWCWSMILKLTDMAFASIAVLTVPAASLCLSAFLLGEPLGAVELGGLALLLVGLATILPFRWKRGPKERPGTGFDIPR
jgi:drug/metabolite transporter (DMT)-like permease